MTIQRYIENLQQRFQLGNATEHTYRGDLQQLIESMVPEVRATNEPKRQACGAPDYILTKKNIPVGFIEAKDIGDKDLEGKKKTGNKEQFDRYKASLNNLIFTDYIDFHFYIEGELTTKVSIAELTDKGIVAKPENFQNFENLIKVFCVQVGQTIKSSKKLAEMMAGKARLLSDVIGKALTSDENNHEDSTLKEQMYAFKDILIHDITPKGFADVYAQTIAYGMFAARLHDPSLDTFSRQEAAELIPKSNPFLRRLFGYIAGPDIDDRIKWIVDNLTEIFLACNVEEILKNYGKITKMEDPIIHFYETFLAEYDPKLRKARGVWYTPAPVVNFIVRAVDDILKTEFNLPQGLADTSKTKITVNTQTPDKRSSTGYKQTEQAVHKVQILDPATGTGTFLAEVIKHVNKKFKGQEGIWSSYVENDLLPRLNGFELLMASYAMAHLQLDLLLKGTGFKPTSNQRMRVYLTNSLEEYHPDTGTLFANWLSSEANEANHIKRDTPVMCVIGNPPYSSSSINKGEWIQNLLIDYKKNLNERTINALSDDYVKFIRYGQHFIDKNGEGILAYISNNSFLDGIIHRQMRHALLSSFDSIYILNLHGDSKKKETTKDGKRDENVFDIMQGVSINIFVKIGSKKSNELGIVNYKSIKGTRTEKYNSLSSETLDSIPWEVFKPDNPNYQFIKKDAKTRGDYNKGFLINELWTKIGTGVETGKDDFFISKDREVLHSQFNSLDEHRIAGLGIKNNKGFELLNRLNQSTIDTTKIKQYLFKPFDQQYCYYDRSVLRRASYSIQRNLVSKDNVALVCKRGRLLGSGGEFSHISITSCITDKNYLADQSYLFVLYSYSETTDQQNIEQTTERKPNLNQEIVNEIAEKLGLTYISEKETTDKAFAPIDILDYIYAVLHSPAYRVKYKEFLKIDFPRVPYPKGVKSFWGLVKLGREIRQIHLLESSIVEEYITSYPKGGDNKITTKIGKKDWELFDEEKQLGRIWINDEQYFDNIPLVAWEFYIGGYQPAQKWLKDRKERALEYEDILHYQKIIVALTETERLMNEIDKIEIE